MRKKTFKHRNCRIKIKETKTHTDVEIVLPNNDKFAKRLIDTRPDQSVPMVENDALEWQLIETTNRLLHNMAE